MSSSSSLVSLSLFMISTLMTISSGNDLVRRLSEESPTGMPTPTPPECKISISGAVSPDIVNPSLIDMGLIGIDGSDIDLEFIDLESGDTVLDADQADLWCAAKFGTKAVTPQTPETYTAMVNLCESLGGGAKCYMGLYREDHANRVNCDSWRGAHATYTATTSYIDINFGNGWANNQPTCPFYSSYTNFDSNEYKHCVEYRTNTNNLRVVPCTNRLHIICEYDGVCNP